jgi:putative transcriptional regulator
MKTIELKFDSQGRPQLPVGRINTARLDSFSEANLSHQASQDEAVAASDAAQYAKMTRLRMGLTQQQFSHYTAIPIDSIRNWEQGKRSPTGAAKTLFKIFNKAPEMALGALR